MKDFFSLDYKKCTIVAICIAILIRFALTALYTVSGDACWHLSAARFISEEGIIPLFEPIGRDEPFWAPPLFHLIASLFYSLGGTFGLKLVSPLFGSLCLIVGYLILRKKLLERETFYAMLFFSFIPIMIDYSVLGYGESVLTFFVLLSIYLALEERFFLCGITAGLAVLCKYNGAFVIPALMWIAWTSTHRWKNMALVSLVPIIVATPWLARNFMVLGNPVWPFLNFLFPSAFAQKAYSSIALSGLWSPQTWASLFLGFFGVPDGNLSSLQLLNIPFKTLIFGGFVTICLIFFAPLIYGKLSLKKETAFIILLACFGLLFLVYVANVGPFVSRMLMPCLIVLALLYGRGAAQIWQEKIIFYAIILFCIFFVGAVSFKFLIATSTWERYQEDFDWVKAHTAKDEAFLVGGQCVQFHIERKGIFPSDATHNDYRYVWVNNEFFLDRRSILSQEQQETLPPLTQVYYNPNTKTTIYERI